MVWNSEKKLLFIHIPKTGGSSIEYSMGCLENKNRGYKIIDDKAIQHVTWNYYKNIEPKISIEVNKKWNIFSIVRNPYDKLVSEFYFLKKMNLQDLSYGKKYFKNINDMAIDDFIDYTRYIVKNKLYKLTLYHDHFMPQSNFIFDNKDNIKINKLFYCYQIKNGDVLKFLNKFEITKIEHKNHNEIKKDLKLNPKQKLKIRQIYNRDFRLLFK